jgi:hypothetical protein
MHSFNQNIAHCTRFTLLQSPDIIHNSLAVGATLETVEAALAAFFAEETTAEGGQTRLRCQPAFL